MSSRSQPKVGNPQQSLRDAPAQRGLHAARGPALARQPPRRLLDCWKALRRYEILSSQSFAFFANASPMASAMDSLKSLASP